VAAQDNFSNDLLTAVCSPPIGACKGNPSVRNTTTGRFPVCSARCIDSLGCQMHIRPCPGWEMGSRMWFRSHTLLQMIQASQSVCLKPERSSQRLISRDLDSAVRCTLAARLRSRSLLLSEGKAIRRSLFFRRNAHWQSQWHTMNSSLKHFLRAAKSSGSVN